MAKKILVPTDLSTNSKAGIRFALHIAEQSKDPLVFYHCISLLKPSRWSEAKYDDYVKKELETARKNLVKMIEDIYQKSGLKKKKFECVVQHSTDVRKAMIGYAMEIDAKAICMSTRGAGRLKKLIGTNASKIIANAPLPVFVIPANHRSTSIRHILYCSDLNHVGAELKKVRNVARQFKAKISVYHYDYMADLKEARKKYEKVTARFQYPNVKFYFQKYNLEKPLAYHLLKDMRKSKASLAVLFTDQKRGWFDKIFLSSKTAEVTYESKIPLLVFPKSN